VFFAIIDICSKGYNKIFIIIESKNSFCDSFRLVLVIIGCQASVHERNEEVIISIEEVINYG